MDSASAAHGSPFAAGRSRRLRPNVARPMSHRTLINHELSGRHACLYVEHHKGVCQNELAARPARAAPLPAPAADLRRDSCESGLRIGPMTPAPAPPSHALPSPDMAPGLDVAATLAGRVAHDVGNLLTILLGNAELLAARPDTPPDVAEISARMMRMAARGGHLAERLSLFARPVPLQSPAVEAAPLLAAHAARIGAGLPAAITLQVAIPDMLGRIALAPAALELALDELMANAIAALGGRGTLRFLAGRAEAGAAFWVEVADDGPGMPAEMLGRAMAPGFAAGTAGHRIGLGLAIAARISAAAGGRLVLESSPGAGTRARVVFPAL